MDKAVAEALRGKPSPNPRVGAVIVRDDTIVSVGYHARAGEAHAEQMAIAAAGEAAKGATLYVTLSPCNHVGKTPKCTDAILAAGIARVVVGVPDPNPNVPGGGLDRLRANGVETIVLDHRGAKDLTARWTKFITTGLPHVAVKLALSLDGRIATRTGASKWITGEEARAKVHELRADVDAVAVGIGTVLADDPRLNVRHVPGSNPIRVVFDTHLRIGLGTKLVTSAREIPTWVLAGDTADAEAEDALLALGVRVIRVPTSPEGRVDVGAALEALGALNVVSLLAEGGAELVGSLLAREQADELHAFVAPMLLGPRGRAGATDWAGPDVPAHAPRIRLPRWELCGGDAYVHGPIEYPQSR